MKAKAATGADQTVTKLTVTGVHVCCGKCVTAVEKAVKAVLAPSEAALEYITSQATIIVDPPRAGLHEDVVKKLLEAMPDRIVYLSCNPVTQARDVARLAEAYGVKSHRGYNFFPRTPHIEHLVVLDRLGKQ